MMDSFNKSLLIVNDIYEEYYSKEEAFIIGKERLEYFSMHNDAQTPNYKKIHEIIEFNQDLENLVDKYLPLFERYLNNENNIVSEKGLANESDTFVKVIEIDEKIDSLKSAQEMSKDANVYYAHVFLLFLKCLIQDDYLKDALPNITYDNPTVELDKLLEKELSSKVDSPKEITLGEYPQDIVKDQEIIDKLNEEYLNPEQNKSWSSFDDRAHDYDGPYMFYIDAILNGQKYRGVYLKQYRPNVFGDNIARNDESAQKHNGFMLNTNYWFKYSPLIWLVINSKERELYLSKYVLDAEPMIKGEDKKGTLSFWLENVFKKVALNNQEGKRIGLLTIDEYRDYVPLKTVRKPIWTDYALIKGFLTEQVAWYPSFVWTGSKPNCERVPCISIEGTLIDDYIENYGYQNYTIGGVRPALGKHQEIVIEEKVENDPVSSNTNDLLF